MSSRSVPYNKPPSGDKGNTHKAYRNPRLDASLRAILDYGERVDRDAQGVSDGGYSPEKNPPSTTPNKSNKEENMK